MFVFRRGVVYILKQTFVRPKGYICSIQTPTLIFQLQNPKNHFDTDFGRTLIFQSFYHFLTTQKSPILHSKPLSIPRKSSTLSKSTKNPHLTLKLNTTKQPKIPTSKSFKPPYKPSISAKLNTPKIPSHRSPKFQHIKITPTERNPSGYNPLVSIHSCNHPQNYHLCVYLLKSKVYIQCPLLNSQYIIQNNQIQPILSNILSITKDRLITCLIFILISKTHHPSNSLPAI